MIQKQKFRHKPDEGQFGDCHRTCVAVVFGVDKELVPHPYKNGEIDGDDAWTVIDKWTIDNFGVKSFCVLYPGDLERDEVIKSVSIMNKDMPFLLSGTSRTGVGHFVVCMNNEIVCDPADSGIVSPSGDYWWIHVFSVDGNL